MVIPRDARPIERKAAADLRHNLKLICGAEFPIVSEDQFQAGSGPYISIGRTELLANSPCKWKSDDLAAEGYALEVVGENVYLVRRQRTRPDARRLLAPGRGPGLPLVLA